MVNLRASFSQKKQHSSSALTIDHFRMDALANKAGPALATGMPAPTEDRSAVLDDSLLIPAQRYHQWDGKNTADLRKFVDYIEDEKRRSLVLSVLDAFQTEILDSGAAKNFRVGVIHGDYNDANILVDDKLKVSAVIDFGDAIERYVRCTH